MSPHLRFKRNRERKTGKEQYYTNASVVDCCVALAKTFIKPKHTLLEPCAGDGAFLDGIKRSGIKNEVLAFDLEPKRKDIVQRNALTNLPTEQHLFMITNPPFGRANSLSVKFFNHLATSCDFIAFLVPKSWRKWSIQNRLDKRFHLVLDEEMPSNAFHSPDGYPHDSGVLKTVFQVWEKRGNPRPLVKIEDRRYFQKTTPQKADVAFTAFGYGTGKVERRFARVPNSTKLFLKVKNRSVIDALERIDIKKFTVNVAYTEVISMEEMRALLNEYFDRRPNC